MGVDKSVFDVFMTKNVFDVEYILSFVIFCCSFPVSECFKGNAIDSWVVEVYRDSFSLLFISASEVFLHIRVSLDLFNKHAVKLWTPIHLKVKHTFLNLLSSIKINDIIYELITLSG